jgi:hypothetical protein
VIRRGDAASDNVSGDESAATFFITCALRGKFSARLAGVKLL